MASLAVAADIPEFVARADIHRCQLGEAEAGASARTTVEELADPALTHLLIRPAGALFSVPS